MPKFLFYTCFILSILILNSCVDTDKNEWMIPVPIATSNFQMTDLGKVNPMYDFEMERKGSIIECRLRTPYVKTGDTIENVKLQLTDNKTSIYISVTTSPFNLECTDIACFSTHSIKFNIDGEITSGLYRVDITVNNITKGPIGYYLR